MNHWKAVPRFLLGGGLLFLLWWLLSSGSNLLVRSAVGLVATTAVLSLYRRFGLSIDIPSNALFRPWLWIKFFLYLLWKIGLATAETCYLILRRDLDQKIVIYESRLKSRTGLLLLLNSITLTPTSVAILHENNLVYVHHLSLKDKEDYDSMVEIVDRVFERPLAILLDRGE